MGAFHNTQGQLTRQLKQKAEMYEDIKSNKAVIGYTTDK